jgi:mono/diheme cytochrome c family protein
MRSGLFAGSCLILAVLVQTSMRSGASPQTGQPRQPAASPHPAPAPSIGGDVEHGRYIVEHVAMCVECHSPRTREGVIIESEKYLGGPMPAGAPAWAGDWAMTVPRNKGLPGYDDAKAMRLLTEGAIGRDGRQLNPPMPRFRMSQRDASDVIAFLRSLQ